MKQLRSVFTFASLSGVTIALALGVFIIFSGSALAEIPESKDPIKLTIHDWTGQYITTHIMGRVLERMGYKVEYIRADYIAQFAGLESGDLHIAMEMWETTGKQALEASLKTGKTVDLGETGMVAIEEWWYPSYMKEKCPGLPDWKALNDCAKEFSTAETSPKGRYLGGPVTWAGFDDERVEALGLNYEVVHAGTDAALFAELKSALERKAPFRDGFIPPTGHRSSSKESGSSFRVTPTSVTTTRAGGLTKRPPMTVESHAGGLKRSVGRTAKKNGHVLMRLFASSGSVTRRSVK